MLKENVTGKSTIRKVKKENITVQKLMMIDDYIQDIVANTTRTKEQTNILSVVQKSSVDKGRVQVQRDVVAKDNVVKRFFALESS